MDQHRAHQWSAASSRSKRPNNVPRESWARAAQDLDEILVCLKIRFSTANGVGVVGHPHRGQRQETVTPRDAGLFWAGSQSSPVGFPIAQGQADHVGESFLDMLRLTQSVFKSYIRGCTYTRF